MTTELMEAPNTEHIKEKTSLAKANATAIVVDSTESYEAAGQFLVGVKAIRRNIADTFNHLIQKAHQLHKDQIAEKKKHDGPLDEAERIVKGKMGTYYAEQERKAREERQRAEREAREAEETRRLAEAEALEKEGRQEEAEQVIEAPICVPVPRQVESPKAAGISTTKRYSFEVVDPAAIPRRYMIPNDVLIGQLVRSHHEAAEKMIPGIKVNVTTGVSARA